MKRLFIIFIGLLMVVGCWMLAKKEEEKVNHVNAAQEDNILESEITIVPSPTPTVATQTTAKKSSAKKTGSNTASATTAPAATATATTTAAATTAPAPTATSTPTPAEEASRPEVNMLPTEAIAPTEEASKPEITGSDEDDAPDESNGADEEKPTDAVSATPSPTPSPEPTLEPPITVTPEVVEFVNSEISGELASTTQPDNSEEGDYFPDFGDSDAFGDYYEAPNNDPSTEETPEP